MKATLEDAQKMSAILEVLKEKETYRLIQAVGSISCKEPLKAYIRNTKDAGSIEERNKVRLLEEFGNEIESAAGNNDVVTNLTMHLNEFARNKSYADKRGGIIDFLFQHKPIFEFLYDNINTLKEISISLKEIVDQIVPPEAITVKPPIVTRGRSNSVSEARGGIHDVMALQSIIGDHNI